MSSAADSVPVRATPPVRPLQNPRSAKTTWVNSADPPMTRTYERPSAVCMSADAVAGSQLLIVTGAPSTPPSLMAPPIPTIETKPSGPELRCTTAAPIARDGERRALLHDDALGHEVRAVGLLRDRDRRGANQFVQRVRRRARDEDERAGVSGGQPVRRESDAGAQRDLAALAHRGDAILLGRDEQGLGHRIARIRLRRRIRASRRRDRVRRRSPGRPAAPCHSTSPPATTPPTSSAAASAGRIRNLLMPAPPP